MSVITISIDQRTTISALLDAPPDARAGYVFAHGAGAGMAHPFMTKAAQGLALDFLEAYPLAAPFAMWVLFPNWSLGTRAGIIVKHQPAAAPVAVIDARLLAQLGRQPRKEHGAMRAKLIERIPGSIRIARRDDAGAGPRGLLAKIALVHHFDANLLTHKEIGRRQANHPAADDKHVRMFRHEVVIVW